METYLAKLKYILPTFFAVTFGTVLGLGFIRWLLCIQFSIIDIKEEIWVLWLPFIFPWIPILLWLRPRFEILTFERATSRSRFFFQIISWTIVAAMLYVSQGYLTTATGTLQELSTIQDIDKVEKSRYYKLTDFSVDPSYSGSYSDFSQSLSKKSQYTDLILYVVVPIREDSTEGVSDTPKYWYGIKFTKRVHERLNNEEARKRSEAFYNEYVNTMTSYDYHALDHFERKPTSDERQNYAKAVEARTGQTVGDNIIVLEPVQERFEDRNGDNLAWIFGSFGIGLVVLLLLLAWPGYSEPERKRLF